MTDVEIAFQSLIGTGKTAMGRTDVVCPGDCFNPS